MNQREILVAPSLLSADFSCMQQGLSLIEKSGGDIVHLDIMDGNFVPNITFGPKMVQDLRSKTELPLDVHLMINDPAAYIDDFIDAGADYLTFHYEATPHVDRLIQRINNRGIKAGLSLVPSTPVELIKNLLPYLDLILIMTVNPGFGGQKLIPYCVDKVAWLDSERKTHDMPYLISVDGGINRQTVPSVISAGVDIIVTGSSFFASEDPSKEIRFFKKAH